jgi:hypothetical protein
MTPTGSDSGETVAIVVKAAEEHAHHVSAVEFHTYADEIGGIDEDCCEHDAEWHDRRAAIELENVADAVRHLVTAREQAERERDEARAKLEATIDALGLAQRTIAATARTFDVAKVPSDLASYEDTIAGTTHNVTTIADRARWLVGRWHASESALRLAHEREARLHAVAIKAHRAVVRADGADDDEADCDAYVGLVALLDEVLGAPSSGLPTVHIGDAPTVTSEET